MIVSTKKPQGDILNMLEGLQKIVVLGCSECATICKTGGEEQVDEMKAFLEANGKEVPAAIVLTTSCATLGNKKELKAISEQLSGADAVLSLACGNGASTLADQLELLVFPGNDTQFVGKTERLGVFEQTCMTCGDCQLGRTAGICPVTRCGKGLLNGPCSGSKDGMCEVNPEKACAWIEIYERLKDHGKLDLITNAQPIRAYGTNTHPAKLNNKKRRKKDGVK